MIRIESVVYNKPTIRRACRRTPPASSGRPTSLPQDRPAFKDSCVGSTPAAKPPSELSDVSAYGIFTIGVQLKNGRSEWTSLEVDLANLSKLPKRFRQLGSGHATSASVLIQSLGLVTRAWAPRNLGYAVHFGGREVRGSCSNVKLTSCDLRSTMGSRVSAFILVFRGGGPSREAS
jgi:hypothetical protein